MSDEQILTITDQALEKILEIRDQEPGAEEFALRIEITGVRGQDFAYELTFEPVEDLTEDDLVTRHGDLTVAVSRASASDLADSTLDLSKDLLNPSLVIDNPNSPSPVVGGGESTPGEVSELGGPTADKVAQLLEQQINPAIAMHGGGAELVGVEDETVYLRLHGGCQGCGMAQVTLRQGIEQAIFSAVPEVSRVVDVTDHAAGENPYYEPAK